MLLYSIVACIVSIEKSTVLSLFLCSNVSFSLYELKIFFPLIIGFKQFGNNIPLCNFLNVSCAWRMLSFLDLYRFYSFHQIWEILLHCYNFFQYFFPVPSPFPFGDATHPYISVITVVLKLTVPLLSPPPVFFSVWFQMGLIAD